MTRKKKKSYGKHRLVCWKHRSKIGGAAIRFGNCENCGAPMNSACGGLPSLCDKCSVSLKQCAECREPVV